MSANVDNVCLGTFGLVTIELRTTRHGKYRPIAGLHNLVHCVVSQVLHVFSRRMGTAHNAVDSWLVCS
jgi:hypothetical protein